jgi:hypothetical protein
MNGLIRLYPRQWRQRYGDEYAAMLDDLSGRGRLALAIDVIRGAIDAHLGGYGMKRWLRDAAIRRGVYDGLIISALIAIGILLTNVVFPQGPDESDSDPEYVIQNLITAGILALLMVWIGARGRRRTDSTAGGVRAGVSAGIVIAVLVTVEFIVMNNLFLSIVGQQHDKRLAFAASGWTSMRAYLTVQQLLGMVALIPLMSVIGAGLGLLGAALCKPRRATHA